jgi:hypothetical protein
VVDIDGDCSITKAERHIISRSDFVFEMLDEDGDGQITQKEYNWGVDLLDNDKDGFSSPEPSLATFARQTSTCLMRTRTASSAARNTKRASP